uniref:Loganic acid O-methyltransferase-like protein n=1 Tax=Lonicera japonica TaxID=105884 RepID=A0A126KG89_LONJA|nr:loganic acid O-methyltransferase-like protein [Lonicera japonica]
MLKGVINAAKAMIVEAITQNLQIPSNPIFRIADLGCSIGPNTLTARQNIIESVELKTPIQFPRIPCLLQRPHQQRFNTLFRTLPPSRRYFAAGVLGSFYNRLFPAATLNFVLSSYAVQWMSKVPNGLRDANSAAFNKGKTYCSRTRKGLAEAYFDQFKRDMSDFLNARAEEVVEGGLMVITVPCVPDDALPSHTGAAMLQEVLGSCLVDMANMGLINEERVDMFNVPLYFPSAQEMELLINMNTHFSIERMETLNQARRPHLIRKGQPNTSGLCWRD